MKILYAAFDAYPGHKGAQAHIRLNLHAARANGYTASLLCLGDGRSFRDPDNLAVVYTHAANEPNLLRRSERFGQFILEKADGMLDDPPDIVHFRDIWSGIPLFTHSISRKSRFVYEVNGLPSIELPGRFPRLALSSLLPRLRAMEDECLTSCDRIITVSNRTAAYLIERGYDPGKISVIPNSVDPVFTRKGDDKIPAGLKDTADGHEKVLLYVGTLASWQGMDTLVDSLYHLRHRHDFLAVIIASNRKNIARLKRRVASRGLSRRIVIRETVSRNDIVSLYRQAYVCVAPLARGLRNELQGCCPIKIIEAMACGIPVVASDLPAIREMISPGKDGVLVTPDSPRALAHALDIILDDRAAHDRLSHGAYQKARRFYMTDLFSKRLGEFYTSLSGGKSNVTLD